jgi:uncharacterized protein YodC (DUF2158 family)
MLFLLLYIYKISNTSRLKTSGPIMIVEGNLNGAVLCQWFAGEWDKVYHEYFPSDFLQLAHMPRKKGIAKGNF